MHQESKHIFLSAITALGYPFAFIALFGGAIYLYLSIITLEITKALIGIGLISVAAIFWAMYNKLSPNKTTPKSKLSLFWSIGVIVFILWLNNYVYQ
ncbi:MAG: hypothetical protein GY931_05960 [Maribacter sp.]|nr:hypothetical protein [Maribacter sp.]